MARMTKVVRIRAIGLLWLFIYLVVTTQLFAVPALAAPPPLGEPNEVWVDIPDTVYVGQEVLMNVYMANNEEIAHFTTVFNIYTPDSASWEWVIQPDSIWIFYLGPNIVTPVNDFRFWEYLQFYSGEWGPVDSQSARFSLGGVTFYLPCVPTGLLEHAYAIHLRPTREGTICIDSSFFPPASDPWQFGGICGSGPVDIDPAWNGPFCITVVEPVSGDINCDGEANIEDAVYLINWIFRGGPPPCR